MMFAQMATDHILADSFAKQMAAMTDKRTIAIFPCAEIQSCSTATRSAAFEAEGFRVVMNQPASLASTSYTSQCQTASNRGAEIMLLGMDGQSVMRFADNCSSIGFEPQWGIVGQAVIDAHATKPNLDGALVATPVAPWFEERVPAVSEFIGAMSTFAPAAARNGAAMQGWTSAKLFEAAARATDDPTTPEGILAGLYALDGDDLGGLTYPMAFSPDDANHSHRIRSCWYAAQISGGQFVSPDGGRRHC
jgi:branched-chain amino acid transport system substrate-binding protein